MSKGLGRIQRGCLRVLGEYEATGRRATILDIASEVYRVRPDRLSDEQHAVTRRALASLQQKGLVSGQEIFSWRGKGHKDWLVRLCDSQLLTAGWLAERMDDTNSVRAEPSGRPRDK